MTDTAPSGIAAADDPPLAVGRVEAYVALLLAAHGTVMLAVMGGGAESWASVAGTALIGGVGWVAGVRNRLGVWLRGAGLIGLTGVLMAGHGGAGSPFLFWLFVIAALYPLLIDRRGAAGLVGAAMLTYGVVAVGEAAAMPAVVVGGGIALLGIVGGGVTVLRGRWAQAVQRNDRAVAAHEHTEAAHAHNRELLEKLFDTIPVMITMYNPNIDDFRVNAAFEAVTGWSTDDARSMDLMKACYPDPAVRAEAAAFMQSACDTWRDFPLTTRDGSTIETSWTNLHLTDDTQVGIGIDISDRKAVEARLRRSRARLTEAQRIAHLGSWESDFRDDRLRWSDETCRIFGWAPQETITYDKFMDAVHPDDRARLRAAQQHAIEETGELDIEYRLRRPSGEVRVVHERGEVQFDEDGTPLRFSGTVLDVTDRHRMDREKARLVEEVRDMSARLLKAQEAERRRIARELHDEVGALLTSMQLCLDTAARHLKTSDASPARTGAQEEVAEAQALARTLHDQVRQMALTLRPSVLDDLGPAAALAWFTERFADRTNIDVQMHLEIDRGQRFDEGLETVIYRVVQEALTNVARHANTDHVQVMVNVVSDRLRIHVIDEGVGFDVEQARRSRTTLGLTSMRERVELRGGTLDIDSAPGEGTRVSATLPIAE